ncbi:MAG: hypothetical protein NZ480_06800 [Bdellovibrionaceae bacterium]|nr:hypothetical protein [Pseudobdellovibrionaceae bacterium]MDW8190201.1 hypothetical protein [Pseudobdellovibrionaceae bacterium]
MDSNIDGLLKDFQKESLNIVNQLHSILDGAEDNVESHTEIEKFGQMVDRIMGGARSIQILLPAKHNSIQWLEQIGNYAEICKAVGYKASQIKNNDSLYQVCVAFLMDATEILENLIKSLERPPQNLTPLINETFIDRLKWINQQLGTNLRSSVSVSSNEEQATQSKIDELLKKLGI